MHIVSKPARILGVKLVKRPVSPGGRKGWFTSSAQDTCSPPTTHVGFELTFPCWSSTIIASWNSRVEAKNDAAQSMSVEVKEATSMVARILIPAHYSLCLCKVLFGNCRVYWCVHKRLSLCVFKCVCLLMSGCINVAAGNPSVSQSLKVKTATNTDTHWQQVEISSISSEDLLLDRTFQSEITKTEATT